MTDDHTLPAAACHCGRAGVVLVGVADGAYCLEHLDDAILAIDRIRTDALVRAAQDGAQ